MVLVNFSVLLRTHHTVAYLEKRTTTLAGTHMAVKSTLPKTLIMLRPINNRKASKTTVLVLYGALLQALLMVAFLVKLTISMAHAGILMVARSIQLRISRSSRVSIAQNIVKDKHKVTKTTVQVSYGALLRTHLTVASPAKRTTTLAGIHTAVMSTPLMTSNSSTHTD